MMIFQAQAYIPKIIFIVGALWSLSHKFRLAMSVRVFVVSLCICGLLGTVVGSFYLNDNPFSGMTLFVIWPVLSLPIIANATTENSFKLVIKAICIAHCFIVAYDLSFAITSIIGISIPNIYPSVEFPFSIYSSSTRMNFPNLNALTFSTPCLALLLLSDYKYGVSRLSQYVILAFTLILFFISGRRSVMMQIALMPFLAFFFQHGMETKMRKSYIRLLSILIFIILFSLGYVYFNHPDIFNGYLQEFMDAFDPSEEPVKFLQHHSLMDAFAMKPLFGHGLGAYFYDPGRSVYIESMELQYQFTLARVGIIGFTFYLLGYWGLFFYTYKLASIKCDKFLHALNFGYLFMLMSHATNPVLNNFDLLLSYFLILSRVNYIDSYRKEQNLEI